MGSSTKWVPYIFVKIYTSRSALILLIQSCQYQPKAVIGSPITTWRNCGQVTCYPFGDLQAELWLKRRSSDSNYGTPSSAHHSHKRRKVQEGASSGLK